MYRGGAAPVREPVNSSGLSGFELCCLEMHIIAHRAHCVLCGLDRRVRMCNSIVLCGSDSMSRETAVAGFPSHEEPRPGCSAEAFHTLCRQVEGI